MLGSLMVAGGSGVKRILGLRGQRCGLRESALNNAERRFGGAEAARTKLR